MKDEICLLGLDVGLQVILDGEIRWAGGGVVVVVGGGGGGIFAAH